MRLTPRTLFLSLLFLLFLGSVALAGAADVPTPDVDAAAWLKALYAAATSGEWKIVGGFLLVGIVYLGRAYGPKVFKSTLGGLVLGIVVSLAGTFGLALATGAQITIATVITALGTAATAAGAWEWIKTHIPGGALLAAKASGGASSSSAAS